MSEYVAHILTEDSLTLVTTDGVKTATREALSWDEITRAVADGAWIHVENLIRNEERRLANYLDGQQVPESTEPTTDTDDRIHVADGWVYYRGEPLHNFAVDRLLQMDKEGHDIVPMVRFLERLMKNPSYNSREQLYEFMEANKLPITEDGYFLAYKLVNSEYKDQHSRRFDNSVGQTVHMHRSGVDDNPNNTCSTGLHFAGLEYLQHFGGSHLMALKIDPADVVSIPTDYNNSKGRCCRYTVIQELPLSLVGGDENFWDTAVA